MTRKLTLITLCMLLFVIGKAQTSNLIFFTEQGERFSVVLNGIQQNENPETNIKVTELVAPSYKVKILFSNPKLPELDKTIFLNPGMETTYSIRKNKKNIYVIRFMNEVALASAPRPVPTQTVLVYHPEPLPPVSTTTTTTTTTTSGNPGGGAIGVNINDPVSGANMNINMNVGSTGAQTTTTTTTTTTSSSYSEDHSGYGHDRNENGERHDHHDRPGEKEEHRYELPGYTGIYGCPYPMSPNAFEDAKRSISSKNFEDSKLTIAKQIVNTNCLLSSQVRELMLLFSFEDTRLDLAKYCYGYTLDIGNYYKVNDAFTFESSIDELNAYINGFRR